MKKKINNYRFQQQQQAKQQYQKQKKIKEKIEKTPVDATEELEYMKKLLNGEDVGNFGPEEPVVVETNDFGYWMTGGSITESQVQAQLVQDLQASRMTLSELLSVGSIRKRKRK